MFRNDYWAERPEKQKFSGWYVFIGCILLMFFPGCFLSYSAGLFQYPICEELGFSITAYAVTTAISSGVNAVVSAFLVGSLSKGNRRNLKIIMSAAILVSCGAYIGLGFCRALWQFYIVTGISSLGYCLVTYAPISMIMSNWFVKKREVVTGIVFASGCLGGALLNLIMSAVIDTKGWRMGYVLGGLVAMVVGLAVVNIFLKRSPEEYGQKPYGAQQDLENKKEKIELWVGVKKKEALTKPVFYLICLIMLLTGIYAAGISTHVVTYLCKNGWNIRKAGAVMTVNTLLGIGGNVAGGIALNKWGLKTSVLLGGAGLLAAVGCLFLAARIPFFAYAFGLFMGSTTFMSVLLPSQLLINTFGMQDYAGIYGTAYTFYLIGTGISTTMVAVVSERMGYQVAWMLMLFIIAAIMGMYQICLAAGKNIREQYLK